MPGRRLGRYLQSLTRAQIASGTGRAVHRRKPPKILYCHILFLHQRLANHLEHDVNRKMRAQVTLPCAIGHTAG